MRKRNELEAMRREQFPGESVSADVKEDETTFPFWRKKEFKLRELTRRIMELSKRNQLSEVIFLVFRIARDLSRVRWISRSFESDISADIWVWAAKNRFVMLTSWENHGFVYHRIRVGFLASAWGGYYNFCFILLHARFLRS